MKKLTAAFLVIAVLLGLCACGGGKEVTATYNNKNDYGGEQGYKNWYYLYSDPDLANIKNMIFDVNFCTWRSEDSNCLIEPQIAHPGAMLEAIYAWKAPAAGKIEYTLRVNRRPVDPSGIGGDGCYVYIKAENTEADLYSNTIIATDLDWHTKTGSYNVKEGEMIYFVLNPSGNYTFDQTYMNITVKHTYKESGSEEGGLRLWAILAGSLTAAAGIALFAVKMVLLKKKG